MSFLNDPRSVVVDVVGSATGEQWKGVFKVKPRLSNRDYLRKDQIRRELLGVQADAASIVASNIAEAYSKVVIHLVEAPSWWKDKGNGLDMEDDEPLFELYAKILALEKELNEELSKKAGAAKDELKTTKVE